MAWTGFKTSRCFRQGPQGGGGMNLAPRGNMLHGTSGGDDEARAEAGVYLIGSTDLAERKEQVGVRRRGKF